MVVEGITSVKYGTKDRHQSIKISKEKISSCKESNGGELLPQGYSQTGGPSPRNSRPKQLLQRLKVQLKRVSTALLFASTKRIELLYGYAQKAG